jgi:NOL1/NOP2/fmu family ribosome biogenesis protein
LSELGAEYLPLQIDGFEGITESPFGYRFFPHKTKGEGFFMAVMRKTSDSGHTIKIKGELSKGQKKIQPESTIIHLKKPDDFVWMQDENILQIYPKDWFETLIFLDKKLNCLENGLKIAELKGKDQIPAYQIALSKAIDTKKTRYIDLNYEQAISFLKKENIILSDERIGYILVGYKGVALGWVKNLGNRCNNLYPAHWKIRMNL